MEYSKLSPPEPVSQEGYGDAGAGGWYGKFRGTPPDSGGETAGMSNSRPYHDN